MGKFLSRLIYEIQDFRHVKTTFKRFSRQARPVLVAHAVSTATIAVEVGQVGGAPLVGGLTRPVATVLLFVEGTSVAGRSIKTSQQGLDEAPVRLLVGRGVVEAPILARHVPQSLAI